MNNKKCKGYFRIGVTSNNNDFSQLVWNVFFTSMWYQLNINHSNIIEITDHDDIIIFYEKHNKNKT